MKTLRFRLVISHILPFIVILPLVATITLYLFGAQILISDLSADLEERAMLISEALTVQPQILDDPAEAQAFLEEISLLIDGEVYLFDAEGRLLAATGGLEERTTSDRLATRVHTDSFDSPEVTVDGNLGAQQGEAIVPVVDVNEQLLGIVGVREQLTDVASGFAQVRRLVFFTTLGGILIGALVGSVLARRLAEPITRSAGAVTAIARGEEIQPLPAEGPTEIRDLSESVNVLSERLRLLEQTRQRSLANIVHELGRPLGAILAAIHVLRDTPGEDPTVRAELLDGVEAELLQMEPLLDDLALLHDDVTGQQRLERQPVELDNWLAASLLPWRAAALKKGIEWKADIGRDLPVMSIDPERMTQVIGNLLSNAVKYTPEDGTIAVSTEKSAEVVKILVSDTGPGIDPVEQERVFEPFYRSRSPQRFSEGLGLGLSIARSLVEAHEGTLTLSSVPGQGSTFTVTLPLQDRPSPLPK